MTGFTRVTNFGDDTVTEIISANLVSFLDWGFINIGAYVNVANGTVDANGTDYSVLKSISVEDFTDGQVWQSQRMNWVWETGMDVGTPTEITGVTVNGVFYASSTTGTYEHYYDYRNGNVVFTSAIPTTSTVYVNHSYKLIMIEQTDSDDFMKRVQKNTHSNNKITSTGKDDWSSYNMRRQLPWLGVEVINRKFVKGLELGNSLSHNQFEVVFYILGEDKSIVRKINDIIKNQHGRRIYLYDTNLVAQDDAFPLDYRGMPNTSAKTYPELVDTSDNDGYRIDSYHGSSMKMVDLSTNQPTQELNKGFYYKPARMGVEVIF